MSQTTKEMNKIIGVIIGVGGRILVYGLVIFLMYKGITAGYEFGHEIFYASSVAVEPGADRTVTIEKGDTASDLAHILKEKGLIKNEYSVIVQSKFYEYDINPGTYTLNTSMTSKEMLQIINENKEDQEEEEEKP